VAAPQTLSDAVDLVIAYFNTRRMDLPDGLFDRKTQFVINGVPFETLLSAAPNDPLVLMLARGPAGYRFTAKALQHAMPDARIQRGDLAADADASLIRAQLWLSGTLRGGREPINALVNVTLRLAPAGHVEIAEATVDPATLEKIRSARLRA
jgi:hypothetical protein